MQNSRLKDNMNEVNNSQNKKLISIISPCFNEEENIKELYTRVLAVIAHYPEYEFEYLFIDNSSTDQTTSIIREIAKNDKRVKAIINTRNFGHIRSPYWGIINTKGAATIYLASDLQDPPELIKEFIEQWKTGYKIVLAIKPVTTTSPALHFIRKAYYNLLNKISETPIIKNATGFGLYDEQVLNIIREIKDPYPYFRGLICELGYQIKTIEFKQPRRLRGLTKNNFYSLYDIGMLGLVSHSKILLRLSAFLGFIISIISIILGAVYLILKILNWNIFQPGIAPLIIAIFFLFGILFGILGIMGEYISVIYTHINNRPIVIEKERINFD